MSRDFQAESLYVELGRRVSHARQRLNLTQAQLAHAVGLTRTSITNLERGRQKALLHTVFALAVALQVPVADLLPVEEKVSTHLDKLEPGKQEQILRAIPELREPSS